MGAGGHESTATLGQPSRESMICNILMGKVNMSERWVQGGTCPQRLLDHQAGIV